ncbi:hypothetical protein BMS3Abin04_01040 [bacterium BMS3Abin04]|nr:hypothetical protein BMS3Abin04_01040 [bacterium BMS3Abin04]
MKKKIFVILAIILIALGIFYFLNIILFNHTISSITLSLIFLIYGIIAYPLSFGSSNKIMLFTSTLLFLIGIELMLPELFVIKIYTGFIATSMLLILGAAFLILFLSDRTGKTFLSVSIIFILLGLLISHIDSLWWLATYLDRIGLLFIDVWPVIIVILGTSILITKDDKKTLASNSSPQENE